MSYSNMVSASNDSTEQLLGLKESLSIIRRVINGLEEKRQGKQGDDVKLIDQLVKLFDVQRKMVKDYLDLLQKSGLVSENEGIHAHGILEELYERATKA